MKHYLKIVLAMLIWSTWGLMIRWLALPPIVVLFYTSLISSIIVPVILKIKGEFPPAPCRGPWGLFAALILSSLGNNLSYFYSLAHTTVSNAVFTHYTAPVLVALLAPMLISERIQKVTLVSLPVAVAGMTLIVTASGGLQLDSGHLPGIAAGTASGIAYAAVIIVSRTLSQRLMHYRAMLALIWATAVITAPAVFALDYQMHAGTVLLLGAAGVLHASIAPLMYFNALRHVLAQHAAILGYIEPLAAIPLAFFFLSEQPPFIALIGGALILISGYLVVHSRMQTKET